MLYKFLLKSFGYVWKCGRNSRQRFTIRELMNLVGMWWIAPVQIACHHMAIATCGLFSISSLILIASF